MKKVIIFYEILSREYLACDKIRKFLKEKYNCDAVVFSITYEYYDAVKFARKNGIDCVVMPWLRLKENYDLMAPFIDVNKNVVICDFSHEQIASDETCELYIPKTAETKNKVFHFCWGEYFSNLLADNGVPKENAVVTGNSRLDFQYECKLDRKILAEEFGLNPNKKWILYAESRDWVLDDCNLVERIKQGLDEKLEQDSYDWCKKYLKEIYSQLNALDEKFFDKFEIIYRPHPSCSNPQEIVNKNVIVTAHYSIYEWLKNVDFYISSASTSAFEAEASGLPVVCFEIKDMPKTFKTYGLDEYYQINSLTEIDEQLFKKAEKHLNKRDVFLKYIGKADGKNCEKVADTINELMLKEQKIEHINANFNKKKFILKRAKGFIKKLLMKSGLVHLVKSKSWCNLAYKDCPFKKENKKMYGINNETRK